MFLYNRNISVEILVDDDNRTQVVSRLEIGSPSVEQKYIYQVWFEFEASQMVIINAEVDCLTPEVPACVETKLLIKKMIGIRLDRTYSWKVHNIFGRSDGCQHLYELTLEIGRAYSNMKVGEYIMAKGQVSISPPETIKDLQNHCAGLSYMASQKNAP